MKDYDPIFDEFPEDDPLISTQCDCAEWRRLNEACADLLLERDALRKDAERYRFLRMCQPSKQLESEFWTVEGDDCDQLVDQEMEKCRTT